MNSRGSRCNAVALVALVVLSIADSSSLSQCFLNIRIAVQRVETRYEPNNTRSGHDVIVRKNHRV